VREEAAIRLIGLMLAVLVPCVPALLLYRKLPESGEVTGLMAGLRIKFTGPAAVYTVIFFLLLGRLPEAATHFHTWTVTGQITFDRAPTDPVPNLGDVFVRFIPPRLGIMNQGAFVWDIPVSEDANGRSQFPDIQIDLRDYGGVTLPLARNRRYGAESIPATIDPVTRTIVLDAPIVLRSVKSMPAYAPPVKDGGR
jgi:hypothetical protein